MKIGTFHTPPANQGQIIEVSYAMIDGLVIRRIHDRSDRRTEYATSQGLDNDEGDYWNCEPDNTDWEPISAQDLNRRFAEEYGVTF